MKTKLPQTERLLKIVHRLRKDCPWDRKQTHRTLAPYLIEEAFEAVNAIEKGGRDLMEELGDVLLQVALHSELGREKKTFSFERVAQTITDKMIRRHPHIYGNKKYKDYRSHLKNWSESKRRERPRKGRLDGLPTGLPALQLAKRYGEIASSVGFDWTSHSGVMKKVKEEWRELQTAITDRRKNAIEEELGDLLFTLANLARHLKLDPEQVLRRANAKFKKRFDILDKRLGPNDSASLQTLEKLWSEIKKRSG